MDLKDPVTGEPLPPDAIQRVLFVANNVHVYNPPPLTSIKGHAAALWTQDSSRHIFTARLRVLETISSSSSSFNPASIKSDDAGEESSSVKVDLVLEDPLTGQLFAAAPYREQADVEPVTDSARFFALTVRDAGRKAVLGIGFEERGEAFDLGVSLQEAGRSLGLLPPSAPSSSSSGPAKNYSLKEGETITVNLRGKGGRRTDRKEEEGDLQSFALAPPPAAGKIGLPPPPSAEDVKQKRRSLRDMGFDDGRFGEFA